MLICKSKFGNRKWYVNIVSYQAGLRLFTVQIEMCEYIDTVVDVIIIE